MKLEIVNVKRIDKSSLCASFDVKFNNLKGMIIRGWTLFVSGDRKWVNPPSTKYESDGKTKYYYHVVYEDKEINSLLLENILKLVLTQLDRETSVQNQTPAISIEPQQEETYEDLPF